MFPAHAGMNREKLAQSSALIYVPRTRGDEPLGFMPQAMLFKCSPHTRG